MARSQKNSDWYTVLAAVVTVAGGLLLVWWQTSNAAKSNREAIDNFTNAVKSSDELRSAVIRPLEGRWNYHVDWDVYFNVETSADDRNGKFQSKGIADIHWRHGKYQVLLGYENSNGFGKKYAVSVNTGSFSAPVSGIPPAGTKIEMSYGHRLGLETANLGNEQVDVSEPPEDRYYYTVSELVFDSAGNASEIRATLDVDTSQGTVTFERID